MHRTLLFIIISCSALLGCDRLENLGQAPDFTPTETVPEYFAISHVGLPEVLENETPTSRASLWARGRSSLFGERRAQARGDILTVVIEIDDRAEFSNQSERSRSGSETLGISNLFGFPQRFGENLPEGTSLANAVETNGAGKSSGDGSVRRNEKLELRVAATVIDVMQNGILKIQGTQEVRVNFELRELLVTGFVRPNDVSRKNEITYDKIAAARISYGGRGQITDVQQPRYGQQVADIILPF